MPAPTQKLTSGQQGSEQQQRQQQQQQQQRLVLQQHQGNDHRHREQTHDPRSTGSHKRFSILNRLLAEYQRRGDGEGVRRVRKQLLHLQNRGRALPKEAKNHRQHRSRHRPSRHHHHNHRHRHHPHRGEEAEAQERRPQNRHDVGDAVLSVPHFVSAVDADDGGGLVGAVGGGGGGGGSGGYDSCTSASSRRSSRSFASTSSASVSTTTTRALLRHGFSPAAVQLPLSSGIRLRPVEFEVATRPHANADNENIAPEDSIGGRQDQAPSDATVLQLMAQARGASQTAAAAESRLAQCPNTAEYASQRLAMAAALKQAMDGERVALQRVRRAMAARKSPENHARKKLQTPTQVGSRVSHTMSAGAVAALKQCRQLYDEGLISGEDYAREKEGIFDRERLLRQINMHRSGLLQVARPKPKHASSRPQRHAGEQPPPPPPPYFSTALSAVGAPKSLPQSYDQRHHGSWALAPTHDGSETSHSFENSAHAQIMLRHRKEHFEVLAGQIKGLVSELANFSGQLEVLEHAGATPDNHGTSSAGGPSKPNVSQDVQRFVKQMTDKITEVHHGLSLVEGVPWPREVLLQDPQVSKEILQRKTEADASQKLAERAQLDVDTARQQAQQLQHKLDLFEQRVSFLQEDNAAKQEAIIQEQKSAAALHKEFEAAVQQRQQQANENALLVAQQERDKQLLEKDSAFSKEKLAMEMELKLSKAVDDHQLLLQQARLEHERELNEQLARAAEDKHELSAQVDSLKRDLQDRERGLSAASVMAASENNLQHLHALTPLASRQHASGPDSGPTRLSSMSLPGSDQVADRHVYHGADVRKPQGESPSPVALLSQHSRASSRKPGERGVMQLGDNSAESFSSRFENNLRASALASGVSPEKVHYLQQLTKSSGTGRGSAVETPSRSVPGQAASKAPRVERLQQTTSIDGAENDKVGEAADSLEPAAAIQDPSEVDDNTSKQIRQALRGLMAGDVEQNMNVKDLRQAVSTQLQMEFDGKPWKKWFNRTVGELDDELAAAQNNKADGVVSNDDVSTGGEGDDSNGSNSASESAKPDASQSVDLLGGRAAPQTEQSGPALESTNAGAHAEQSGHFSGDELGELQLDEGIENPVGTALGPSEGFGNSNTAPPTSAGARLATATAAPTDPASMDQVLARRMKDTLRQLMADDVDQSMGVKELRQTVATKLGLVCEGKAWKKWFNGTVSELDDELAAAEDVRNAASASMTASQLPNAEANPYDDTPKPVAVENVGGVEDLEELDDIDSIDSGSDGPGPNSIHNGELEPLNQRSDGDEEGLKTVTKEGGFVNSISDPSQLNPVTATLLKDTLRTLMVEDIEQKLNVRDLRQAVSEKVGIACDGKAWKKWFNQTVGDLDDELAAADAANETDGPHAEEVKEIVENPADSNHFDTVDPELIEDVGVDALDDLDASADDGGAELTMPVEAKQMDRPSVVAPDKKHNVDIAEASDSEYLKQVGAFVFKLVEADEEGTITMKEVRRQVSAKFDGNDFSSGSWKKWLKASVQSAIDKLDALEAGGDDVEELAGLDELEVEPLESNGATLHDVQTTEGVGRKAAPAPSEMDAETAAKVKVCLRKLMVEDVDQQMNVKKLRERVGGTLDMEFDGKAWKKWFNNTVGDIDDELAAASGSGTEVGAGDTAPVQNVATDFAAIPQEAKADTKVSPQETVPFDSGTRHHVDDAEASEPKYLTQVSDFVFDLVEADDEGQITMKDVRRKVADEFDNDFSSPSWKKWLKNAVQVAIDKIDGDAASQDASDGEQAQDTNHDATGGGAASVSSKLPFIDNPDELSKETSEHVRDLLRQLMFDDVDQAMNVKKLRAEVTQQTGWEFQHKGWKWWFNTVVGELDDELADSEADLLPPLPGTSSKQEASPTALATSHVEASENVKSGPTVDSATDEQLDSIEDAINAALSDGEVAEATIRKRVASAVGFSLETKEWQAYVRDVVREFAEEDSARAATSAPAKVFEDPADLDGAMTATIVRVLREVMIEDVDQLLDVKALRKAVEERVSIGMKTKPWKKWFGDRVAELDVELGDGVSDADAQPEKTASKSAVAEGDDVSFDSAAESANFSDEERRDEGSTNTESANQEKALKAAPKVAKCSDDFLDEIEDEIQKVLDADGGMTEADIRIRIGKTLKVSFEAKEWVKYCHEVVVDCRLEKYAEVQDPEDITPTLRTQMRQVLKRIMVDDTEQKLDAKACRGLVTEAIGVAFKSKAMKGWFGDLFLEVDDELADDEEAAN